MDATKLEVLKGIYSVQKVCGLCEHGSFPHDNWGTCSSHAYQHLKHTGAARQLSVVKFGSCPAFKADETKVVALGAYREFFK
jgi:hypothetical protein